MGKRKSTLTGTKKVDGGRERKRADILSLRNAQNTNEKTESSQRRSAKNDKQLNLRTNSQKDLQTVNVFA